MVNFFGGLFMFIMFIMFVLLIIFAPLLIIWALNTLFFPVLFTATIPYNLATWFAILVVFGSFKVEAKAK